jgi:hypothetical protein
LSLSLGISRVKQVETPNLHHELEENQLQYLTREGPLQLYAQSLLDFSQLKSCVDGLSLSWSTFLDLRVATYLRLGATLFLSVCKYQQRNSSGFYYSLSVIYATGWFGL